MSDFWKEFFTGRYFMLLVVVPCAVGAIVIFGARPALSANMPTANYSHLSCLDKNDRTKPDYGSNKKTPLVFWMTKGKSSVENKTVSAVLNAMSCTDMPVPGVTISIAHCDSPNFVFHIKRTRKLNNGETVFATKNGHQVFWKMYSANPFTVGPSTLTLTFDLSNEEKGPFCISGAGTTEVSSGSTSVRRLTWN